MFGPQQQEQIRAMVRAGKSTRYIAARLGCSPATVVNYAGTEPRPGELRQYLVKLGAGL